MAIDIVVLETLPTAFTAVQGLFIQRNGVRADAKRVLKPFDEQPPVNLSVKFFAQFQKIFGVQTATRMNVEFTAFEQIEMCHRMLRDKGSYGPKTRCCLSCIANTG